MHRVPLYACVVLFTVFLHDWLAYEWAWPSTKYEYCTVHCYRHGLTINYAGILLNTEE